MILQIVPKVEVVRKDKLMMYDNFDTLRSSAMAIAMALHNDAELEFVTPVTPGGSVKIFPAV